MSIKKTLEYQLIKSFYLNKKTSKGVPYINHIHEGLIILDYIKATIEAKKAYCLHPMFQEDQDFKENIRLIPYLENYILCLSLEYRNIANSYLSKHLNSRIISLSPIKEVNNMLIADKVQNYKDFLKYNKGRKNAKELEIYFNQWFNALGIDYKKIVRCLEKL